jgi:ketosteroid isomerase-like protein
VFLPPFDDFADPRRLKAVSAGPAARARLAAPHIAGDRVVGLSRRTHRGKEATEMTDFQAIADRVEIEALRGEFTDAAMMRDRARLASLFTPDGALRMPNVPVEQIGREQIRAGGEELQALWEFFVQTTHPGTIQLDGDTATGRAYIQELVRTRDGRQGLNYAIYHDRYQRTGEGWKFTERVYEVRYLDTTPLAGSAPR